MKSKVIYGNYTLAEKELDDCSVDLFFCDPPYFTTNHEWDKQWKSISEYVAWTEKWLQLAYDKLNDTGSIYVCIGWEHSGYIQQVLEKIGFHIKNRITWKRDKGRGSKTNWKNMHEDIWFATKHKTNYTFNVDDVMIEKEIIAPYRDKDGNPKGWFETKDGRKIRYTHPGNLWTEFTVPFWSMHEVRSYAKTKRTPNNTCIKHPTQKPKGLVKKCILASSNKNDTVVDFFAGSGTTGIASKELNRNFILFDNKEEYIQMIQERLKNE